MTNDPTKIAYLAGILDGEGCFYISRTHRKGEKHKSLQYQPKLYVGVTDKPLIDWIHKYFGGLTYVRAKRPKHSWRTQYTWVAHAITAVKITQVVLPYLVIKKAHAEIFLNFQKTIRRGGQGQFTRLSKPVLTIRESYFQAIKHLNARNTHT